MAEETTGVRRSELACNLRTGDPDARARVAATRARKLARFERPKKRIIGRGVALSLRLCAGSEHERGFLLKAQLEQQ
eukprot:scaffold109392_cov72-Phaeocystis_antarctica.AAC.6